MLTILIITAVVAVAVFEPMITGFLVEVWENL